MRRRTLLVWIAALSAPAPALAQRRPVIADEMVLGSPAAPLTLYEYASLACTHCARFHNTVFPAFKAKYVDTGQVRLVFREMLVADPDLAKLGPLVARCAGEERYFEVVGEIYRNQGALLRRGQLQAGLRRIGQDAGLTRAEVNACMADRTAAAAEQARMDRWFGEEHISSTPTFVIGDRRVSGEMSLAELDLLIAAAKGRAR